MPLRSGHGEGRGRPHLELLKPSELPDGVPAMLLPPAPLDAARDKAGLFGKGNTMAKAGGNARRGATKLAEKLRLSEAVLEPSFEPYRAAAEQFRRYHVRVLAERVGGGECGPAPMSIVASAALQLAASRWAFDRGEMELGSKLANDSRQNLLAAYELCVREAKAQPKKNPTQALAEGLKS